MPTPPECRSLTFLHAVRPGRSLRALREAPRVTFVRDYLAANAAYLREHLPSLPATPITVCCVARPYVRRGTLGCFCVGRALWVQGHGHPRWEIEYAYGAADTYDVDGWDRAGDTAYQLAVTVLHELVHLADWARRSGGRCPGDTPPETARTILHSWAHDADLETTVEREGARLVDRAPYQPFTHPTVHAGTIAKGVELFTTPKCGLSVRRRRRVA